MFVDGISNQTILRANITERSLQRLGEYIRTKNVPKLDYGFCSKTWLVSHFLDIITFYHFFQRPAHYKILSIISAKLIEIKSIVRTVMSSPISSSLLSPFLFIRYFFTITLCKTHAFLRYHCWGWGSHRVSQTTKCNQQRSHSLTEYNATVWRRPVVYWTEWFCLHKVLHIFVFTCKFKREISLKIIQYSIPTSIKYFQHLEKIWFVGVYGQILVVYFFTIPLRWLKRWPIYINGKKIEQKRQNNNV